MTANSHESTNWCCITDQNPIRYGPGNLTLYYNAQFKTGCLFGFITDCSGCITDHMWCGYYEINGSEEYVNFRISFTGDMCSTISGITSKSGGSLESP